MGYLYCVVHTPPGVKEGHKLACREFQDDIRTKQEAFRVAKRLKAQGHELVYVDKYQYDEEPGYDHFVDYWHI